MAHIKLAEAAVPMSFWFGLPCAAVAIRATKTERLTVKIRANVFLYELAQASVRFSKCQVVSRWITYIAAFEGTDCPIEQGVQHLLWVRRPSKE